MAAVECSYLGDVGMGQRQSLESNPKCFFPSDMKGSRMFVFHQIHGKYLKKNKIIDIDRCLQQWPLLFPI